MDSMLRSRARGALRTVCALGALAFTLTAPAVAQDFPRLGLQFHMSGNGQPLWGPDGVPDPQILDQIASYHEVIIDAEPITPYRPDVAAAIRARRPSIRLLAYVQGHNIWNAQQPDSFVHYPTRYRRLVRDLGGFLYDRQGREWPGANVNLAKRAQGRFVVAEGIADLFRNAVLGTGSWDGLFIDIFCNSILWSQSPAESIDFVRAGYPNAAAFDAAWLAASDTLANRLRRTAGSQTILVGNCAQGTKYTSFNGWMRENFPLQNGGSWNENMYRTPGGYLTDEARFRAPTHNFMACWRDDSADPYAPTNVRRLRFGLGSAALGDGFSLFNPSDLNYQSGYFDWWYDEYAVDRATGRASIEPEDTGWMGAPLGPCYTMYWAGTNPDACSNPGFETDVTSGWTLTTTTGATRSRDMSTPAVGVASARLHLPTASSYDRSTVLSTANSILVMASAEHSATFWARASSPRSVPLAIVAAASGEIGAVGSVELTTDWRQHQVVLSPNLLGQAVLEFWPGRESGDVWLDDVHFQRGITGIYRRDFQHGIVLVNPTIEPLEVRLEDTYRKILGEVDPTINDGETVTEVTVPAADAVFLLAAAGAVDAPRPAMSAGLAWHASAPNPFGESVRLVLAVPRAGIARVAVFDARGRRVAILREEAVGAGEVAAVWDGRDASGQPLPAGLYLVRAEVAGETAVRKIVKIR